MTLSEVIAILFIPTALAIGAGLVLLKKAFARPRLLPEEVALAVAWVFMVGSLVWVGIFLSGSSFLGFGAPWSWLAAAHFAFAGFGALTITALCCRVVSNPRALATLRSLLLLHPVIYLITAGGILGFPYCDEIGSGGYAVLFATQLGAVLLGQPDRMPRGPRILLVLALMVPVITIIPAITWAWERPMFNLSEMVRYHGLVNAIGHVGLGLIAFALGRPPSHAMIPNRINTTCSKNVAL